MFEFVVDSAKKFPDQHLLVLEGAALEGRALIGQPVQIHLGVFRINTCVKGFFSTPVLDRQELLGLTVELNADLRELDIPRGCLVREALPLEKPVFFRS